MTYTFEEKSGSWSISGGDTPLTEGASLSQKDDEWVLTDPDGTQFQIDKVDDSHIYFQQVAAEGVLGTTASVEFVKIKD